jgi:hypothetical protein
LTTPPTNKVSPVSRKFSPLPPKPAP